MKLRGGEFSIGTMGNFQPELTRGHSLLFSAEARIRKAKKRHNKNDGDRFHRGSSRRYPDSTP